MRYKTGRLNDLQKTKSFARVDVKFTKSFLNDALVIGVYANDLFKTDTEQWTNVWQPYRNEKRLLWL